MTASAARAAVSVRRMREPRRDAASTQRHAAPPPPRARGLPRGRPPAPRACRARRRGRPHPAAPRDSSSSSTSSTVPGRQRARGLQQRPRRVHARHVVAPALARGLLDDLASTARCAPRRASAPASPRCARWPPGRRRWRPARCPSAAPSSSLSPLGSPCSTLTARRGRRDARGPQRQAHLPPRPRRATRASKARPVPSNTSSASPSPSRSTWRR